MATASAALLLTADVALAQGNSGVPNGGADATGSLVVVLVVALAVIVLSFVASMTEAAFLSLPRLKAQAMTESEGRFVRLAGRMRLNFAKPLAAIVVLNNLANVTGSAVFGLAVARWLAARDSAASVDEGVWIASAVLTFVVIIAGEIVPKTIGERYAPLVARIMAPIVRALQAVLSPVLFVIGLIQKPFMRVGQHHVTSEEEISRLTALGEEQQAIEEDEAQMIRRVFRLNDITAEDIMTPRVDLLALECDRTLGDIADELGDMKRSRIPLYREDRDHIVAVLDRTSALLALTKDRSTLPVTDPDVAFRPFFVPESMPADDLMVKLQRRTDPMAIVVDEYGATVGVVTLEDVVEELVGDIVDDADLDNLDEVRRISDTELVCDGRTEVNVVNELLGTLVPNHRTVAGLLLEELERIPKAKETVEAHGARFTVVEANERAILRVRIECMTDDDEETEEPPRSAAPAA